MTRAWPDREGSAAPDDAGPGRDAGVTAPRDGRSSHDHRDRPGHRGDLADDVARSYRVALLRYVHHGQEVALHSGYELGRTAVGAGVSILAMAQLHHDVLVEVLRDAPPDDVPRVATAASEFFLEVLATSDMAQRAFLDGEARDGVPG